MADLTTGGGSKSNSPKTNKKSTKIDMTAMVDVAFLLLTFFVLTATISEPNFMSLMIPPTDGESNKIIQDKIMTIILDEGDGVLYYTGIEDIVVKPTDFSYSGIRLTIMRHLAGDGSMPLCLDVDNQGIESGRCWDPIFVVKAKPKSRYRNLVDVLDEIKLADAPKYALDDFTSDDSIRIAQALESSLAAQ